MKLVYRDDIGVVVMKVDESGIDFLGGTAFFGDGERDYRVPVESIVRIEEEE